MVVAEPEVAVGIAGWAVKATDFVVLAVLLAVTGRHCRSWSRFVEAAAQLEL